MRIDYIITGLGVGGAETQAVSLVEHLSRRGHRVRMITLTYPVAFLDRLAQAGVTVVSLDMRSALDLPYALYRLVKLLKNDMPDVVHSHMVHANIIARLSRLFLPRLKVICTAHNTHEGGKLRDLAYKITNRLSDINTTISEAATRRFIDDKVFPARNTRTIFNGIDINRFSPRDYKDCAAREFIWVAVGRFTAQKDYPTLLNAFVRVKSGRLLIMGEGALREKIQAQINWLGLGDRVTIGGLHDNIPLLYQEADGLVLSSAYEGYGLVVAEAMASSLPVVVTDSGGPAEIVGRDGRAGYIVPIKDPVALADALIRVMALSDVDRKEMGICGRQRIQDNFSLDQTVLQWEALYQRVSGKTA